VSQVIDGDSFTIDSPKEDVEIRLTGVNAPEASECFHDEATRRLTRILKEDAPALERSGADRFGRVLAHVYVGELHVNAEMVARGLALATPGDGDRHEAKLLEAENTAWRSGAGLWAPDVWVRRRLRLPWRSSSSSTIRGDPTRKPLRPSG